MRVARLDLLRYGGFADRHYDFASSPVDLQILHGANEAGKSTMRQAISDLLFGFPHNKEQDWCFDATQLRVGACLEQDGASLEITRKRGTKQTLLARDGVTPVDENILKRWLGNTNRIDFEHMWSLDHQRLRAGGKAMADFEGDLGKQLLVAGFGLHNVQIILNALAHEADILWKAKARTTELAKLAARLKEARLKLSNANKDIGLWKNYHAELETIEKTLQTLQDGLGKKSGERRSLERISRLRAELDQHRQFSAALAASQPPLFTKEEHAHFTALVNDLSECETQRTLQKKLYDERIIQRDSIRPDTVLLEQEDRLDAFKGAFAHIQILSAHLTTQRETLSTLDRSLRMAGQKGPYKAILAALPDPDFLIALHPLAERHDTLTRLEQDGREAIRNATEQLASAKNRLDTATLPPVGTLAIALQQAARRDTIDADIASLQHKQNQAKTALAQAIRDLTPWHGPIEALQAMAIPEASQLEDACTAWRERQKACETISQKRDSVRQDSARESLTKAQLVQRSIVSLATLTQARTERDQLLDSLLQHTGDQIAQKRFREAQHRADTLADRRFDDAEESAKLTQIEQKIDHLQLEETHHTATLSAYIAEQDHAARTWYADLIVRDLPRLDPAPLRGWCALRARALEAEATLQDHTATLKTLKTWRSTALSALQQILPDLPPYDLLSDAIIWAQSRHDDWQAQAGILDARKRAIENQEHLLGNEQGKAQTRAEERALLEDQWRQAVTSRPDVPLQSVASLNTLMELHKTASEASTLENQIDTHQQQITEQETAFVTFVRALGRDSQLAHLSPRDVLTTLLDALKTARDQRASVRTLDDSLAGNMRMLEQIQTAFEAAMRAFTDFAQRALGFDPTTDALDMRQIDALKIHFGQEKSWYDTQALKAAIETRLTAERDAPDPARLQQQAEDWPEEMVTLRLGEIDQENADDEKQLEALRNRRSEIRAKLNEIDEADTARDASVDIETCRAEMASAAESWVALRIQTQILTHVARQQRNANTNPLLKSAEAFFTALTCGRYRKLTITEDHTKPQLTAEKDNEDVVSPGAMSEGTRDQLFLSLRLAALEQARDRGITLPFIADDLFITFDEARAKAGLATLATLAQQRQILFLTHHAHLAEMAGSFGAVLHSV